MINPLKGKQVCDSILKQGYSTTEAAAYSWKNITEGIANTGKGALTAKCGGQLGSGAFKVTKDVPSGNIVCASLCSISMGCETVCGVITWVLMH